MVTRNRQVWDLGLGNAKVDYEQAGNYFREGCHRLACDIQLSRLS